MWCSTMRDGASNNKWFRSRATVTDGHQHAQHHGRQEGVVVPGASCESTVAEGLSAAQSTVQYFCSVRWRNRAALSRRVIGRRTESTWKTNSSYYSASIISLEYCNLSSLHGACFLLLILTLLYAHEFSQCCVSQLP